MPPPARRSKRLRLWVLAVLVGVSAIACSLKGGGLHLISDVQQYLDTAYHIAHDHTYTDSPASAPAPAQLGREPGYPLFLAVLMTLDPQLGSFTPECISPQISCDPRIYRSASWANVCFILGSGAILYFVALRVCGGGWPALISAAYLLLNFQSNNGWQDPMSDRLAVLLVCIVMLAACWAWQSGRMSAWSALGLALAGLTLVKASFFYFNLLLFGCVLAAALVSRPARGRILAALAIASVAYAVPVGGWIARNWEVSGQLHLTDLRGGMSLSARNAFDNMTAEQYLAAFAVWTRGFGGDFAKRHFPPEIVGPFGETARGGFQERGQNEYSERVQRAMTERGLNVLEASAYVDRQLELEIIRHPLRHLATTLPLFYRGIWADEFIVLGLPLFVWMLARSLRRRDALAIGLLSIGAFNLLFYAALSSNAPRYQMTAIPALALGAGMAAARLSRARQRRSIAADATIDG
jgi:hypothetical protein